MASVTPRASGFWTDSARMNYFEGDADDEDDVEHQLPQPSDGRTPLDRTIDRIGMGSYQWTLLSLCGFGWMADNMWIQAVAIILPRVQQHFSVPDSYIGMLSSSMFGGMAFGALGWGTCSDLMGRSTAFNATLFFTSVFGLLASFANSFATLCLFLFLLGSAVGGSMPTDGTLLLEHMPKGKQYLVTALSVFFSFGAVLSAIVALLVVPQNSCPRASVECDIDIDNRGWKYMLITLGLITLSMFIARILFFRLHESPRFLVHAGRHQEALESLQLISRFNGSELRLHLDDVDDYHPHAAAAAEDDASAPFLGPSARPRGAIPDFGGDGEGEGETIFDAERAHSPPKDYHATTDSPNSLDARSRGVSPAGEATPHSRPSTYSNPTPATPEFKDVPPPPPHITVTNPTPTSADPRLTPRPPRAEPRPRMSVRNSRVALLARRPSSLYEVKEKVGGVLPRWIHKPLWAWLERVAMVLSPEWIRTTLLMWSAWFGMSLAYTMFNVFLPKLLETRGGPVGGDSEPKSLEDSLWDVVIFTLGGCPGAIVGAYMVESPLGRRWSLAGSTFVTAFFCVVFVIVETPLAVRASTVGISLSATAMYAVLYGWTPEIFGTKVRGTACGVASALSRIGGMIAPLVGGMLLMVDRSFPVYASVVIFGFSGVCVLFLREDAGDGGRGDGERVIVH
ncbi:hypothetical protein PLICRDRAFT_137021 [Plicaturopsis crispa FD-325 SS-3]|nr:hypothetical protein PLICRDRAFT_137021 [Plicaturopsis crispa FD-325 SS-3]